VDDTEKSISFLYERFQLDSSSWDEFVQKLFQKVFESKHGKN